jgi:hypothetical protein
MKPVVVVLKLNNSLLKKMNRSSHILKYFFAPTIASLCALGVIHFQLDKINKPLQDKTKETFINQELAEQVQANLLKNTPSFGYNNLIADWSFLKFLVYFGDGEAREKTGYSIVTDYFETVVKNDPRFVESYFYISPANSLFAGRPDRTVELITEGLKSISPQISSKSYFLWMYKAVDELLFLGDSKAARQSYENAAQWAKFYNNKMSQNVATRAQQTSQFLAKNPDSKQAQIGAWTMLLSNAINDKTRQVAIDNIKKLGGTIQISPNGYVEVTVPKESRV